MAEWQIQLIINTAISGISAGANLYYILKHANGKKKVRLISFVAMIYFTLIQGLVVFGYLSQESFGSELLRPWMPVLYLLPVFDVIVDFKKQTVPKGG